MCVCVYACVYVCMYVCVCVGEPDYDNNFNAKLTKWKVGPEPEEIIVDRNNNTVGHGRFTQGTHVRTYFCICIFICMYVCMYLCMYLYTDEYVCI